MNDDEMTAAGFNHFFFVGHSESRCDLAVFPPRSVSLAITIFGTLGDFSCMEQHPDRIALFSVPLHASGATT